MVVVVVVIMMMIFLEDTLFFNDFLLLTEILFLTLRSMAKIQSPERYVKQNKLHPSFNPSIHPYHKAENSK